MGINIITDEIALTREQKSSLTRFVNKNCSYYFFLNFIKITNGNVADAIKLYYLDEELRSIVLKYLLRLEIQMKKDFISIVEKNTSDQYFWNNPAYYIHSINQVKKGHKHSLLSITVKKMNILINNMNYSTDKPTNSQAFYASTFGDFKTIHQGFIPQYKHPFNNKYLPNVLGQTNKLQKYFICLKIIRNRCCHSNHLISLKLKNELNNRNLDQLELPVLVTPFEQCLYFIYSRLDNKKGFKRKLLSSLKKYQSVWNLYSSRHILSKESIDNIENYWK